MELISMFYEILRYLLLVPDRSLADLFFSLSGLLSSSPLICILNSAFRCFFSSMSARTAPSATFLLVPFLIEAALPFGLLRTRRSTGNTLHWRSLRSKLQRQIMHTTSELIYNLWAIHNNQHRIVWLHPSVGSVFRARMDINSALWVNLSDVISKHARSSA